MVNEAVMSDRRAALRDALIASAERVIGERGHLALRARDLAQDVGCALGAIYGVFPDLDALVLAVKARALDELDSEIVARLATARSKAGSVKIDAIAAAKNELRLLAEVYLAFAFQHPRRWQALFEHRSPDERIPEAYVEKLERIFGHVDRPLSAIAASASPKERRLFGRALFAAVHGVVALGLDQKLESLPLALLSQQIRALVEAACCGIIDHPEILKLTGNARSGG